MKDSIQTVIKTIEKTSDNGIELINKVDSFYNSAWDKLIIIGTFSFAIIGILVPFIIQWYQKQTLKTSENLLKKEIETQILKIKFEILAEITIAFEEKLNVFENKIEQFNASSTARTFHLQGNGQLNNGLIKEALADYITAAQNYSICEDFINLQNMLKAILDNCLHKLSKEEIEDLKISHNRSLEKMLDIISSKDDKKVFNIIIRDIRYKLSKLPKTIKDKTETVKQQN
jgi:hypothetical protein